MLDLLNGILGSELSLFGIFLALSVVGSLIFMIALVFDGLFDIGGDVPVVQMFGVFTATSGAGGMLAIGSGVTDVATALIVSLLTGLTLATLTYFLIRHLRKEPPQLTEINPDDLVGEIISVSWWDATEGEVLLELGGNNFKVPAESKAKLVSPRQVKIKQAFVSKDKVVKAIVEKV